MMFRTEAEQTFDLRVIRSDKMDRALAEWRGLEQRRPAWTRDGETRTIGFSNTIARELATLVTLNVDIKVQGDYGDGAAAEGVQKILDRDGFGYWDVGAEPARTVRSMEEAFSAPRSVEGRVRAFVGNASGRTARFRSPEDGTEVDLPNGGTAEFRYRVGRMGEPAAYGGTDSADGV